MNTKLVLLVTWGIVLIGILFPATVSAEILVGVKAGDRVEYDVYYYVTGDPPSFPHLIWREIEVLSVQGTNVTFDLTGKMSDGTLETDTFTEDLEAGVTEALIIPANLSNGDMFYHEDYGFITISEVESKTYAQARRTIVGATAQGMLFYWDRTTGVLVEFLFYSEYLEGYMHAEIVRTNMWQGEFSLPIDPTLFYVLIIVAVVIVAAVVFLMMRRQKKTKPKITQKKTRKKTR